ncbi:hypothetical protein [Streptomyces sp. CBMA123]|uniref:hypothetical protein n=1 Tax=Streptomyces sp. CBMA123 TaxID=1896313 RepID=UPI001661A2D3|nr:hypothetical protein [Streptomyces sp. CBMA123]MBD0688948.1 hypothetical protein [Streptomyces sp. CBMA123]
MKVENGGGDRLHAPPTMHVRRRRVASQTGHRSSAFSGIAGRACRTALTTWTERLNANAPEAVRLIPALSGQT